MKAAMDVLHPPFRLLQQLKVFTTVYLFGFRSVDGAKFDASHTDKHSIFISNHPLLPYLLAHSLYANLALSCRNHNVLP